MNIGVDVMVFVAVAVAVSLFGYRSSLQSRATLRRIRSFHGEGPPEADRKHRLAALLRDVLSQRLSEKTSVRIQDQLLQSGLEHLKAGEFAMMRYGFALVLIGIGWLVHGPVLAAVLAVLGWMAPMWFLAAKKQSRLSIFERQLGDAVQMMADGLRAGNSLQQSIDMVRKEAPEPIAGEFALLLKTVTVGASLEEGCANLVRRVPSADVKLLTSAMVIHRQVGGNLAEILDMMSQTIRERIELKGQIRALTSQGRFSALIVGALPIGLMLMMYLSDPGYMSIEWTTSVGRLALGAGLLMECLGFFWMRKITSLEL